jgi:MFS family permease
VKDPLHWISTPAHREVIEEEVEKSGVKLPPVDESRAPEIKPVERTGYVTLVRVLFSKYPARSVLGASLMISQSFLHNAIFFTYTLVLTKFYGVDEKSTPVYLIAFCVGNLAGPLTIGRLFDTIGRKRMISGTYLLSGVLLAITASLFQAGVLTATTQTIAWCVNFFFASAGPALRTSPSARSSRSRSGRRPSRCSSRSRSASAHSGRSSTVT